MYLVLSHSSKESNMRFVMYNTRYVSKRRKIHKVRVVDDVDVFVFSAVVVDFMVLHIWEVCMWKIIDFS